MKLIEYIKNEHKKIMETPKNERLSYIWEYYKWYIIVFLLVVVLLVQGILSAQARKETVFSGFMLNCKILLEEEEFLQGFYDYAGIDSTKQEAAIYNDVILTDRNMKSDITAFQRIMAGVAVKDTDFIVGLPEPFRVCAYSTSSFLMDLRKFLDADTLEAYEDRLYYIDGAVLEQLKAPVGENAEVILEYPDPHKPELMEDPIPVGIDVSDRESIQNAYYLPDSTIYIGVVFNTTRPELTQAFIEYLWK